MTESGRRGMMEGGEGSVGAVGGGGLAAEDDLDGGGVVAGGEDGLHLAEQARGQVDVIGRAGALVVKMRVRVEVRAVAGRAALEVHRADEAALDERVEA